MAMQKTPITPEGHKKLQDEFKRLKSVEMPKAICAVAEARAHGDLTENAEYDIAKDHQAQLSQRIKELEHKIATAQVIDPASLNHTKVVFGATVVLRDLDEGGEIRYKIVGADESDISKGLISVQSPIARALIGKEVGNEVNVQAPSGARVFEVLGISYE